MASSDLTGFYEEAISRPRGRTSELSDPQIQNRRDQFVQIFEGSWGEIGWALQRCKKPNDLIGIFKPIADPNSWVHGPLSIFCQPSSEPGSSAALRKIRAERRALVEPIRSADETMRRAQERLHQVNWALNATPKRDLRLLKQARKARRKQYWNAMREWRNLSGKERALNARLKESEASFARTELFRFLKGKRYALAPLTLAGAAAGLPYMGWRQSMRRTLKSKCVIANGTHYQIFKSIRYIAAIAKKKSESILVMRFRDAILSLPSRYRSAKDELSEKWFYLERAIRLAYRAKPRPKALPYEITRRYFNQLCSQSPVNSILAELAKLSTAKPLGKKNMHAKK